jgi:FlaA1/EpsC-like NDP-sugar epimerase
MRTSHRAFLVFLFDLVAPVFAWAGAFLLRFNFQWPYWYHEVIVAGLLILIPIHALACRWAGLYRGLWIFASLPDLKRVLRAVLFSSLALSG